MDIERQKNFIIRFIYWTLAAGIVYCVLKYVMPLLTPFVIGFLVAVLLRPLAYRIAKVARLNQKWTAVVILLLFYAALATILVFSGIKLASMIGSFFMGIPVYYRATIEPALGQFFTELTRLINELDPSLQATVQGMEGNVISTLYNLVTSFSTAALNWATGFASAVPLFVVNFAISVISSFFVSADYPGIKAFIIRQIKPKHLQLVGVIRDDALKAVAQYVKAYAIMMGLMFVELSIGLLIIGIGNALLVAMGIAVFDAFPILGTGGILIPWALIELINGRIKVAIQIIVLYAVVTLVRNFTEPKIVGQQIGLHPLVTLLCLYVGASMFGVAGLLGFPLVASIINNLNEKGVIKLFNK